MGIDAKDIRVCIWRILKFLMNTCYIRVRKHPFVSGILLLFFLLYKFYASVFRFLIYTSPVLVCTVVLLRIILSLEHPESQNVEKDEKRKNSGSVEELDDLIGQSALIEETTKEIRKRKASSCFDCVECSHLNASNAEKVQTLDEQSDKFNGGGGELEAESQEEAEDEDEEEAQEDGIKGVEWTEDDQKNLMDLGTSEIERNKRLESLIAKRRESKLLRKQVQKNLIDWDDDPQSQIAPVLIARSNLFAFPSNSDGIGGLPMPGSAPSVLLPMQNPFDLPYDPFEEKPNLMGDSFHQEFMADHQKDTFFCRHESFSLGPLFLTEKKATDGPGYSRFKRPSNKIYNEKLAKQALSQEGEPKSHFESAPDHDEQGGQHPVQVLNSEEIKLEEDRETENSMIKVKGEKENTHDNGGSSSSSSSSEVNEENFNANKDKVSENLEPIMGNFPNGQTNEPCYDSSPSEIDKTRMEEHLFYANKRENHAPTYSIDSDLQVEISEVGSPPLTVDGTISSFDGESLTYDGDVEKEITSGSEELWGESSHLSGVEETESRSRELHDISEEDITVGFSGANQNSEDPIAPPVLPEQVVEQDSINSSSLSSPRTELPEEGQAHSVDFDQKIHDEFQQVVMEEIKEPMSSSSSDALPCENLASPVPEKAQDLTEKLVAHPSGGGDSEKPEEPSNSPEKYTGEGKIIYNVSDPVVQANEDTENLQSIEDQYGEVQLFINHEADDDLSKVADKASSKSIEYIEDNFEKPEEHQTILESYKQVKENDNSESNTEFEGEFEKLNEHKGIADESNPNEDKDNLKSTHDNEGEQGSVEFGISGVNRNSDGPIASAVLPELVVEQVPIDSSSILSPKSVLPENVPVDQVPSLNFHQMIHVDVQQSDVDDNSLHEMPPENLSLTTPQNVQHLIEDSMALPSNYNGDFEILQEPSNPPGNSTEEANIIYNVNESVASEKEDNLNLRFVEDSDGESQLLIRQEAVVEPSKPAEGTSSRSMEDVDGESKKLIKDEAIVGPSKSVDENVNSTTIKDVEELEQALSYAMVDGESKNLTECEAMVDPSKLEEENHSSNISVTVVEGEELANSSQGESTEESNITNVNESVDGEMDNKENLNSVGESEGESQRLIREEAVLEPLEAAELTNVKSTEDIEGESEKLTEDEMTVGPSYPAGETDNPNTIKDIEESEFLIDHEDTIDPPKPGEGKDSLEAIEDVKGETCNVLIEEDTEVNKSFDHKIVVEPLKPMDSKVEVLNPDMDNGYKEAAT